MSKKVVFGKEIGSLNHELSIQESFDKNDSNGDKKNKGVTEYVGNGTNLDMDEYDNRYNIQEPNILPHDTDLSRWVVTHKNDNVNDVLNHAKKTSITTNDQVKFGKNIGILGLTKDFDMGKRKKQLSWLDTGWICNMEGKYAEHDDTTQLRIISSIKGHDLSSVVLIQEATAKWNLIELNQKQANQKDEIDLSDQGVTTNQEIEFLNFNRKIGVTRLHDSSDRIEILKFNEKSVVTGLTDAIVSNSFLQHSNIKNIITNDREELESKYSLQFIKLESAHPEFGFLVGYWEKALHISLQYAANDKLRFENLEIWMYQIHIRLFLFYTSIFDGCYYYCIDERAENLVKLIYVSIKENGDIWLSKKYGEKFKDLGQDYEMWVVDFQELTSQVHENSHNLVVIGVAFQDSNSKNFGHSSKAMKFKY
ncbi:hypothetical protein E3N88_04071 [Mikania micrantha]|uniref:Uncharacterized protein n=1 Tax=Mikania micrantha TaxID=192012 RepID=A0A5N6PUB2_9ASTR|nr:hypothetical protein E3N88_04071 [Mikania micrantha]